MIQVLARALRVHNLKDMFSATRHILQSVTRDPKTQRVRSIKPGEKVENMWDGLDQTARAWSWCPTDGEVAEGFMPSYKYTEADEIEDALLFPEEIDGKMKDNLYRYNPSALDELEKGNIDVRGFTEDLDTDEESDDDGFEDAKDDPGQFDDPELAEQCRLALEALGTDNKDSDWDTDEEDSDIGTEKSFGGPEFITTAEQNALDQTGYKLSTQMKEFKTGEPDYFLSIVRDPTGAKDIPDVLKKDPANLMNALRQSLRCLKEYDMSRMGMHADFIRYTDSAAGMATAATEATRTAPDLYIDYLASPP